jgi:hypothetical protein
VIEGTPWPPGSFDHETKIGRYEAKLRRMRCGRCWARCERPGPAGGDGVLAAAVERDLYRLADLAPEGTVVIRDHLTAGHEDWTGHDAFVAGDPPAVAGTLPRIKAARDPGRPDPDRHGRVSGRVSGPP